MEQTKHSRRQREAAAQIAYKITLVAITSAIEEIEEPITQGKCMRFLGFQTCQRFERFLHLQDFRDFKNLLAVSQKYCRA